jgi:hypothetical protein
MSHPSQADLDALIQALLAANIEFIVVGGAAAVLHGAPITTQDLDIVHRRTAENVQRLSQLLAELDARFRGRDLRPKYSRAADSSTCPRASDRSIPCVCYMMAAAMKSFCPIPPCSPTDRPRFASSISTP